MSTLTPTEEQPTPSPHASTVRTVQDVLSIFLTERTTLTMDDVEKLLLGLNVLNRDELARFFSTEDTFHCLPEVSSKQSRNVSICPAFSISSSWASFVAEKYMKALASEYALLCNPKANTGSATLTVALLVGDSNVLPVFYDIVVKWIGPVPGVSVSSNAFPAIHSLLHSLVFLLLVYTKPKHASKLVLPIFRDIVETRQSYAEEMPLILTSLMPNRSFQTVSPTERLRLIFQQMETRKYVFSLFVPTEDVNSSTNSVGKRAGPGSMMSKLTFDELLHCAESLTKIWVHLERPPVGPPGETQFADAPSPISDAFITKELPMMGPRQLYALLIKEAGLYCAWRRSEAKQKAVNAAAQVGKLTTMEVSNIMRNVHQILRMQGGYGHILNDRKILDEMIDSHGWLPLSIIQRLIESVFENRNRCIPDEQRLIVEDLLLNHDSLLRYEVGWCKVKGSAFYNQRCARSVYAHEAGTRSLKILDYTIMNVPRVLRVESVPKYGWILFEKHRISKRSTSPMLPLYDRIRFVVVLPPEALASFYHYRQNFDPERQFDEKIKYPKALTFVEVYLRALVADTDRVKVYPNAYARAALSDSDATSTDGGRTATGSEDCVDSDEDNSTTPETTMVRSRWYVFPDYAIERPGDKDSADTYTPRHVGFPKLFLTGRYATLSPPKRAPQLAGAESTCVTVEAGYEICRPRPFPVSRIVETRDQRRCTEDEFLLPSSSPQVDNDSDEVSDTEGEVDNEQNVAPTATEAETSTPTTNVEDTGMSGDGLDAIPWQGRGTILATGLLGTEHQRQCDRLRYALRLAKSSNASLVEKYPFKEIIPRIKKIFACYLTNETSDSKPEEKDGADQPLEEYPPEEQDITGEKNDNSPTYTLSTGVENFSAAVEQFVQSPERYAMLWWVPKVLSVSQGSFNVNRRLEEVKQMKLLATTSGLRMNVIETTTEEVPDGVLEFTGGERDESLCYDVDKDDNKDGESTTAAEGEAGGAKTDDVPALFERIITGEVYELRKPFLWAEADVVAITRELGLEVELRHHLPRLRLALTRECENKTENYEMLEFSGDASMDFVVAMDGFISTRVLLLNQGESVDGLQRYPSLSMDDMLALWHGTRIGKGRLPSLLHEALAGNPSNEGDLDAVARSLIAQHAPKLASALPITYDVATTITTQICRNDILRRLLPRTASRHLDKRYRGNLGSKVKADIFEAIIGVVYTSQLGLDMVRKTLRRLFQGLIPQLLEAACVMNDEECIPSPPSSSSPQKEYNMLLRAVRSCPYLFDCTGQLSKMFPYSAKNILEPSFWKQYAPQRCRALDTRDFRANVTFSGIGEHPQNNKFYSHAASMKFPRIQEKSYASHFTTGLLVYSYRTLPSLDSVLMFNRILRIFSLGGYAFTNEQITKTTHLVFDFDGANVEAHGVVAHFWNWYRDSIIPSRGGRAAKARHCPSFAPAMMVLDCTGIAAGKESVKESSHVHLPQVVVRLRDIPVLRDSFLTYLFSQLGEVRRRLATPMMETTRWRRVLLTSQFIQDALARHHRKPCRRHMWQFCAFEDLLAISHTCKKYRLEVYEHIGHLIADCDLVELAKLFSIDGRDKIIPGLDPSVVAVVEDVDGQRWLLPEEWVSREKNSGDGGDIAVCPTFRTEDEWSTIVDSAMASSKKLRMYLCDKCDTKYGFEHRPLFLDRLVLGNWSTGAANVQTGQQDCVSLRQCRVERPDKTFVVGEKWRQHQQRQTAVRTLKAVFGKGNARPKTDRGVVPFSCVCVPPASTGDELEELPVVVAHSSTLRFTTLRCPTYRDVQGLRHDAWQPIDVHSSIQTDGAAPRRAVSAPLPKWAGVWDSLPTYADIIAAPHGPQRMSKAGREGLLRSEEVLHTPCSHKWELFLNICSLRVRYSKDLPTTSAKYPSWWMYNEQSRTVTFYLGGEPIYSIPHCDGLMAMLRGSPTNATPDILRVISRGMENVGRLLVPHIDISMPTINHLWFTAYGRGRPVFPWFVSPSQKERRPPVPPKGQ
uniref:Dicer 1 n=1 Tax=Herpetomonas muscarum TaxID=5718 RepID=A0A1B2LUM2_HERMU|nr:dicer 1 [Herpetomonas muscarum]